MRNLVRRRLLSNRCPRDIGHHLLHSLPASVALMLPVLLPKMVSGSTFMVAQAVKNRGKFSFSRCWRRRQMVYSHLSSAAESEAAAKEEDLYGKDFSIPRPTVIRDTSDDEEWRRRQEELQRRQMEQLSGDDLSSEASSEASWEEHYERRVTTDSRRTETTRTVGGAEGATSAEIRVYPPAEERYREATHETTERSMRETTEEGGDRFAYAASAGVTGGESHRVSSHACDLLTISEGRRFFLPGTKVYQRL